MVMIWRRPGGRRGFSSTKRLTSALIRLGAAASLRAAGRCPPSTMSHRQRSWWPSCVTHARLGQLVGMGGVASPPPPKSLRAGMARTRPESLRAVVVHKVVRA